MGHRVDIVSDRALKLMIYYNYTRLSISRFSRTIVTGVCCTRRVENRPRLWGPDSWHVKAGNEVKGTRGEEKTTMWKRARRCSAVGGRNASHRRSRRTTNDTSLYLSLLFAALRASSSIQIPHFRSNYAERVSS